MNDVKKKIRQNRSTLRQRQAEATANLIIEAAKSLFLERGYAATTMEAVAERAEVAISTVYAVFNSKRGILRAIRTPWHARSQIREVAHGEPGIEPPEERLEQFAEATRKQWEFGAEIIAIYSSAAAADPEAASELKQALAGRRKGMETFAKSLSPYLRQGLDTTRATDILEVLCLAEVYFQLVHRAGWTKDEYQSWLAQTLKRELLGSNE